MRSMWLLRNRLVRLWKGLPPPGQAPSPEIPDNLFAAHFAAYRFAAERAAGQRVLDLGSGTGYGAGELAAAGATEVVGVELDPKAVAWARRRYGTERVRFLTGDATRQLSPELAAEPFGLVVALNLLAQVEAPGAVIRAAANALAAAGSFLASVPPILDGATKDRHRASAPHVSHLYLWEWEDLLRGCFGKLRLFAQLPPSGQFLDLGDPGPARVKAEDYRFPEVPLAAPEGVGHLAAIFLASDPLGR